MTGLRSICFWALLALVGICCDDDEENTDSGNKQGEDTDSSADAGGPDDTDVAPDAGTEPDGGVDAGLDTGTFPAVGDTWVEGPFTAKTVEETGPDNVYTLFRPEELAPDGVRNPIVVWGNGGGTTPALYTMLPFLATHGFVVIAPNNTIVTGPELIAGVQWLIEQNADPTSELFDTLDIDNAGAMGYSNGSLATYAMLEDLECPNLVTTIHVSGGIWVGEPRDAVQKEPGPTAYFCDAADTKDNCDGDFEVVEVPCFYGSLLDNAEHISIPAEPYATRVAGAVTAWFRWHLMKDESQKQVFLGEDCTLCTDPNWGVQVKNWEEYAE